LPKPDEGGNLAPRLAFIRRMSVQAALTARPSRLACRAALKHFAPGHPENLISMSVRFAAPAYPGDTIRIELFAKTRRVHFRAHALERNVLVLDRGEIQLA